MLLHLFEDLLGDSVATTTGGDNGDNGDNALSMRILVSPTIGDSGDRNHTDISSSVATCRQAVANVDPAFMRVVAVSPLSPAQVLSPVSACWLLIEGDKITEITIWPPATAREVQRDYPGLVVEINSSRVVEPDQTDLDQAATWALLLGERDVTMIQPFAEHLGWLRDQALAVLHRDAPAVIAGLSDAEVIKVAMAVTTMVLPPVVERIIATMRPALQGKFAQPHLRARTARDILHIVATV